METLEKNRSIYISARLWHEYQEKVNLTPFINAIEEHINLSNYGEGLHKFYFTFLVMNPNGYFKPVKIFSKKKKEADISVEIPYEQIEAATKEEAIKLMEQAYLKGIDKLALIKNLTDFDVAAFKSDVEAIFSQEKWYEIAEAA